MDVFFHGTYTLSRLCTGTLHTGQRLKGSAHEAQQQKCRQGRSTMTRGASIPQVASDVLERQHSGTAGQSGVVRN